MIAVKSESERLDLIASDVKIIESSTIEDGFITFPPEYMPDGREYRGQLPPDGINNELLQTWCGNVRSQYDAREESKRAEKAIREEADGVARGGQATPSTESGGVRGAKEASVPAVEEGLYQILTTRLEILKARQVSLSQEHDELTTRLYYLQDSEKETESERAYIEEILFKLGDSYDSSESVRGGTYDTQKNSKDDSTEATGS